MQFIPQNRHILVGMPEETGEEDSNSSFILPEDADMIKDKYGGICKSFSP